MLRCDVDLSALSDEEVRCGACTTCQARSKLSYPFVRDLTTSDQLVQALRSHISTGTPYTCDGPEVHKNPDIRVLAGDGSLVCRVEAKMLEGYAFMKAAQLLSPPLAPKETLVIDEPKLLHYFECRRHDRDTLGREIPIFVVWKFDRPCPRLGGITVFQEIKVLESIHGRYGAGRSFERKTVSTDYVDGMKRGVTAKYHYSLRECRPIHDLLPAIASGREAG